MRWPTPAFRSIVGAALLAVSPVTFAQLATSQPAGGGEPTDVPVKAVVICGNVTTSKLIGGSPLYCISQPMVRRNQQFQVTRPISWL